MSRVIKEIFRIGAGNPLTGIPEDGTVDLATATVPLASRFILGPQETVPVTTPATPQEQYRRMRNLVEYNVIGFGVKVLTIGTHANFVVTLEGSLDGVTYFALTGNENDSSGPPATVTRDQNGVTFSAALGQVGFFARIAGFFPFLRAGLAGDNAAADGTAILIVEGLREN